MAGNRGIIQKHFGSGDVKLVDFCPMPLQQLCILLASFGSSLVISHDKTGQAIGRQFPSRIWSFPNTPEVPR